VSIGNNSGSGVSCWYQSDRNAGSQVSQQQRDLGRLCSLREQHCRCHKACIVSSCAWIQIV